MVWPSLRCHALSAAKWFLSCRQGSFMIASSSVQGKMVTWREPNASLPEEPMITLREIIKIKLRSSV